MIRLDCKLLSERILNEIKGYVDTLMEEGRRLPGLAVVQVGDTHASTTYVRKKKEKAEYLGFNHIQINLPEDTSEETLISEITRLNGDTDIDGILVQLPLPSNIDEGRVIDSIDPSKDVDGFSPINVGKMVIGKECFIPCTPKGILEILKEFSVDTVGKDIVVVGRSNIVGRPIANLLSQKPWDGNVTLLHSRTPRETVRKTIENSDIVILAVGYSGYADSMHFKDNAVIIDVGINRVPDPTKKSGFRLRGDFEPPNPNEYPFYDKKNVRYTPVPGGVGLMTVCCLMENTLEAYKRHTTLG